MDSPKFNPAAQFDSVEQAVTYIRAQADPQAALTAVVSYSLRDGEYGFAEELIRAYSEATDPKLIIKELQDALAGVLQVLQNLSNFSTPPKLYPCVQQGLRALGRSAGISTFGNDWMDALIRYREKQT